MVRMAIWNLSVPHATSTHQRVTVSVGVAAAAPAALETVSDLLEAADAALYVAKRRGRNTVVEHGFVRSYDTAVSLSA
jgi:diguanylate cyclase (GGDEF)-like protein